MEKTNFENLQIYQLSEKLADQIWRVVIGWENFGRETLGKQLVRAVDSVGPILQKEAAAAHKLNFVVSCESPEAPSTKRSIG